MPSHSKSQSRLFRAAAHNPELRNKAGIPLATAQEFSKADQKINLKALPERVKKRLPRKR